MLQFTQKEIDLIKQRFEKISKNGKITYQQFKDSMGILALDNATQLLDRLFICISCGQKTISLDQYILYLKLAMLGSDQDKAFLSFRFMDIKRNGYIEYKDFELMMLDMTMFWNQITGSRITPRQKYISNLWDQFNCEKLDPQLFFEKYQLIQTSVDWFEYFNESEIISQQYPQIYKAQIINNLTDQLQNEIRECVNLLTIYEKQKKNNDESLMNGPCNFSTSQIANNGDDDPSFEISFLSKIKSDSISLSVINQSENPLDQMLQRIELLQQLVDSSINLQINVKKQPIRNSTRQSMGRRRATIQQIPKQKTKRQITVYFGHENWNLILNLMIGMKKAVSSIQPEFYATKIFKHEFNDRYVYDIMQQRSNHFDFRKAYQIKDYAPSIFLRIRQKYQISNEVYERAIGPENLIGNLVFGKLNSLTELGSTGKSGSFFYYTQDCQYMIKTISQSEANLMKRIIPKYFQHTMNHQNCLLSRIFGFHQLKIAKSKQDFQKIYLVSIVNIFRAGLEIDIKYDIKGSLYGRKTDPEQQRNSTIALKDLDLLENKCSLNLEQDDLRLLLLNIKEDSEFLKSCDIIDYSLLVGFHKRIQNRNSQYGQFIQSTTTFYESFEGGLLSKDREWIYYIGIIDILTVYSTKKILEYGLKSTLISNDISCVPPKQYAERFYNFIQTNLFQTTYI